MHEAFSIVANGGGILRRLTNLSHRAALSAVEYYRLLCVVIYLNINIMIIKIGNKPLKDLTAENILDIIKIIGARPSPEVWGDPVLLDFDNELFSDNITVDYVSYRKSDNKRGQEYTFFFNHKKFYWHYTKDYDRLQKQHRHHTREFSPEVWRYLIQQGFDVPLYNNA